MGHGFSPVSGPPGPSVSRGDGEPPPRHARSSFVVLKKRQPTFDSKPEGQKNPRSGDQMQRPECRHHERIVWLQNRHPTKPPKATAGKSTPLG